MKSKGLEAGMSLASTEEENKYAGEWWTRGRVTGEEFREVVHVQMNKTHGEGFAVTKSTVASGGSLYTMERQDLISVLK